jgi:hypothetical protein
MKAAFTVNERTTAKFPQWDNFECKMGEEFIILRTRERKNGDNLHGAIALPPRHLPKERLINQLDAHNGYVTQPLIALNTST